MTKYAMAAMVTMAVVMSAAGKHRHVSQPPALSIGLLRWRTH